MNPQIPNHSNTSHSIEDKKGSLSRTRRSAQETPNFERPPPSLRHLQPPPRPPLSTKGKQATSNSYIGAKGLKLRDYLYLTSISKKEADQKRSRDGASSQKVYKVKSQKSVGKVHSRKQVQRQKYQVSNEEIFEVVKGEIREDLDEIDQVLSRLRTDFSHNMNSEFFSNNDMIEIYDIRRKLKETILPELNRIESFIARKDLKHLKNSKMVESFVAGQDPVLKESSHSHSTKPVIRKLSPN